MTPNVDSVEPIMKRLYSTTRVLRYLVKEPLFEMTPEVRFLGHTYERPDDSFDVPAVATLLASLDRALVHGRSEYDATWKDERVMRGLLSYSWGGTDTREKFYKRVEGTGAQVIDTGAAEWMSEGEVAAGGRFLIGVERGAVCWRQLNPLARMDLVPDPGPRALVYVYGYLELRRQNGIFHFQRG